MATLNRGLDAAKPAAGNDGHGYFATDTGIVYEDNGSAWIKKAVVKYTALDSIPSAFPVEGHASSHQHGGADPISTATPAANAIPKAGAGGQLAIGFLASGTPDGTKFVRDDGTLITPGGGAAHATSHEPGGADPMAVDAAAATGSLRTIGTTSLKACAGDDDRLSNTRTPTAHAPSHKSGGSDAIKLDEFAAPTDVTTLNSTISAHGLLPKMPSPSTPSSFFNDGGTWTTPKLDALAIPDDITDLNASTTKHGLMMKYPGGTTNFLRSDGAFAAPTASVAISSADVAFTDGDTMRRVTITDAGVGATSKIVGTVRRPDTTDDSADRGYLYIANVVEVVAGAFDLLVSCLDWGFGDPTENPPNETVKFLYTVAA